MMNYAWMGFEIGTIRESLLRDMLAGMFTGEGGGAALLEQGSRLVDRQFVRKPCRPSLPGHRGRGACSRHRCRTADPLDDCPRSTYRARRGGVACMAGIGRRPDLSGRRSGARIAPVRPTPEPVRRIFPGPARLARLRCRIIQVCPRLAQYPVASARPHQGWPGSHASDGHRSAAHSSHPDHPGGGSPTSCPSSSVASGSSNSVLQCRRSVSLIAKV